MSAILRAAGALGVAAIATTGVVPTASAATSTVPVPVVPGVPRTVEACKPGGFFVQSGTTIGDVRGTDTGFVYTVPADTTLTGDTVIGRCDSDITTLLTFRITIQPKPSKVLNPITDSFIRTCAATGKTGTVTFDFTNSDRVQHNVAVVSQGLTPSAANVRVAANSSQSAPFTIGARAARVALSVNGGRPGVATINGCPAAGTGIETGRIAVPGPAIGLATGGGHLATQHTAPPLGSLGAARPASRNSGNAGHSSPANPRLRPAADAGLTDPQSRESGHDPAHPGE